MPSAAGLSATYGGYQKARAADNAIESGDIQNQQARIGQEADAAWGNTIPVLTQMLQPGATAMPGAGGAPPRPQMAQAPQAPPPGQPSVEMVKPGEFNRMDAQAPGAPPMQPPVQTASAGPQPQMLGGPSPPGPQAAAAPQTPPQTPPQAPQQPGGQPQGRLDLHTVMGAVVKANPGAKPAVIAAAVAKALPLMTAQSQMDYKNLMVQLSAGRLNETTAHHAETEGAAAARNTATAGEYASRDERRKATTDQGAQKLDLAGQREARLAAQAEVRNDQRYRQLDQQKAALEDRIQKGGDRAALSEWRAIVDAQHKRALEIIQSGKNAIGVMDPTERAALVKEQNEFYRQQIEQMRKGPARPERPAGADTGAAPGKKTEDRPPASGPPGQQGAAAPPRARNPKTGEEVEFVNGQWTPVRQPQASM